MPFLFNDNVGKQVLFLTNINSRDIPIMLQAICNLLLEDYDTGFRVTEGDKFLQLRCLIVLGGLYIYNQDGRTA